MKAKELNLKAIKLQDEITETIVDMMNKKGASIISFASNGDNSDFDVDRAYAFYDDNKYGREEYEVVAAVLDEDNGLQILINNGDLSGEVVDMLFEKVIFKAEEDKDIIEKINSSNELISVMDTLAPTDTLCQLVYSVEETLNIF